LNVTHARKLCYSGSASSTVAMKRARKRAALAIKEILCRGVVQQVLEFLGPGHAVYIATVCKAWQESYSAVEAANVAVVARDGRTISFDCTSHMTFLSLAFTSPAAVRWAHRCGLRLRATACANIAGRYADISTLAAAHKLGLPWSATLLNSVALWQRLDVLKWLHIDRGVPLPQDITHSAASGGSVVLLQWLATVRCAFDRRTSYYAALAGHMHVLQYLRSRGCRFDKECVDAADEQGDLAMVRWLLQRGCPWSKSEVAHIAAQSGSIALMDWLLNEHHVDVTYIVVSAAEAGQLAMCQYLIEQGCLWCEHASWYAAQAGHCEVLRWLREAGCPYPPDEVLLAAAASGNVATLAYLQQAGELSHAVQLTAALAHAGSYDRREAAVWLREQGAEWPPVLQQDGSPWNYWSRDMVAWARAEGWSSPVSEFYTDPYTDSEANSHNSVDSDASDSSEEFSSCSDTDESSSDHNTDSDASSTLHTGYSSSDDYSDGGGE
jgi:hypothetical protein